MHVYHKKGRYFELLKLSGLTPDGLSINSETVFMTSFGPKSDKSGASLTVEGSCSELTIENKDYIEASVRGKELSLQYTLLGFKCFGQLTAETDNGLIRVSGATRIRDYDEVSGSLIVEAPIQKHFELSSWMENCDKSVRLILDILSLAQDHYIAWTSRSLFSEDKLMSASYIGPRKSGPPYEPLFSHLNLQPILNLAVSNYTEAFKRESGFNVALEWFLIKSTYAETQFLFAMTALEYLVYIYSKQKCRSVIFKEKEFKRIVRPLIVDALDKVLLQLSEKDMNSKKLYNEKIKYSKDKISEINRYTFKENLFRYLSENRIPLNGIEGKIGKLIHVRDKIVHRGLYEAQEEDINYYLNILRELVKRIFLTLLKYNGEYQTFLEGPEYVKLCSEA